MTEYDERDHASRRYRELPAEEPPAALDAAIRAHARRALVRRQWYVPAATAAILVLAIAVTWNVEREQPDMVAVAPAPAPAQAPAEKVEGMREAREPEKPKEERRQDAARDTADLAKRRAPAVAAAPAPAPAPRAEAMMSRQAFAETPQQWLERIAKLRAEGKHEEADQALAEFRKRYPDFRISPELLEKVEKK